MIFDKELFKSHISSLKELAAKLCAEAPKGFIPLLRPAPGLSKEAAIKMIAKHYLRRGEER